MYQLAALYQVEIITLLLFEHAQCLITALQRHLTRSWNVHEIQLRITGAHVTISLHWQQEIALCESLSVCWLD